MAYFAQLNSDNEVINVIIVKDSNCQDSDGNHSEAVGISFCQSLVGSDTTWVESTADGSIRNKPAAIGGTYDSINDRFVDPKPYDSWTLNQSTGQWEPPIAKPDSDGTNYYTWNEDTKSWVSRSL